MYAVVYVCMYLHTYILLCTVGIYLYTCIHMCIHRYIWYNIIFNYVCKEYYFGTCRIYLNVELYVAGEREAIGLKSQLAQDPDSP